MPVWTSLYQAKKKLKESAGNREGCTHSSLIVGYLSYHFEKKDNRNVFLSGVHLFLLVQKC
jgi:hypothetical protein